MIYFIGGLCAFMTFIAVWKPHYMWGIVCFASWWLLFFYTRTNPFAGFTVGDAGDTIFTLVIWAASLTILINTVLVERKTRRFNKGEIDEKGQETKKEGTTAATETPSDYHDRLYRLTHAKK